MIKPIKQHKNKPDYDNAKKQALKILSDFGYTTPYVDPVRICKEGYVMDVFFVEFSGDQEAISGFFYAKKNAIYINKNEHPRRQTFTIAHELGHKILHENWFGYKVSYRDSTKSIKDWHEQEADTFAANLLVPEFMLKKYYKIATVEELSRLFIVTMPVIQNRLKNNSLPPL